MEQSACSAIARLRLPAVDPGEHDGRGSAVAAFLLPGIPGLLQELSDLLVHDVEVLVDVIGPHVEIRQLDGDMEAIVETEPVDYVYIGLRLPVAADRLVKLAGVKHGEKSLSSESSTYRERL